MNRRLRRIHRGAFLVLALALPAIVLLALHARRWPPPAIELPGFLAHERGITPSVGP